LSSSQASSIWCKLIHLVERHMKILVLICRIFWRFVAPSSSRTLLKMLYYFVCVVEPPKSYGPHAPVIVPKTSDSYARVPDNLKSLSGVLRKPESSIFYNSHRINKGVTTTLQYLLQNFTS
jgi:hypothetical protein